MLSQKVQDTIRTACVTLEESHARGVLLNGCWILTAAHCIQRQNVTPSDSLIWELADPANRLPETIRDAQNDVYRVFPYAVELYADIAVLGPLPWLDPRDFAAWRRTVPRVRLALLPLQLWQHPVPIYVPSLAWEWRPGTAPLHPSHGSMMRVDADIWPGMSGSPIVMDSGAVIGIISSLSTAVVPQLALPAWVSTTLDV